MSARFSPGETVTMREVWRGHVWAARPMTCVRDDDEIHAFWFPRGARWFAPRALDGARLRVPTQQWRHAELTWDRNDNLILVRPGAARAGVFADGWESWRPDPAWPLPELDADWER